MIEQLGLRLFKHSAFSLVRWKVAKPGVRFVLRVQWKDKSSMTEEAALKWIRRQAKLQGWRMVSYRTSPGTGTTTVDATIDPPAGEAVVEKRAMQETVYRPKTRPGMGDSRSNGHLAFVGNYEYWVEKGQIFRASHNTTYVNSRTGYRSGGRWQGKASQWGPEMYAAHGFSPAQIRKILGNQAESKTREAAVNKAMKKLKEKGRRAREQSEDQALLERVAKKMKRQGWRGVQVLASRDMVKGVGKSRSCVYDAMRNTYILYDGTRQVDTSSRCPLAR